MDTESRILEVCVASVEDAVAAEAGGADRLELNLAWELGGLTPSRGLFQEVRASVALPVITLVRPRPAGFRYSAQEVRTMQREAELLLADGADGLAFGALDDDGRLDSGSLLPIVRLCHTREAVLHRAFDCVADQAAALEAAIDLGFQRILTSGGWASARQGAQVIRELVDQSADRIELLPGGGVTPENACAILRATRCRQLHGSFRTPHCDPAEPVASEHFGRTSRETVQAVRAAMDACD